MPLKRNRVRTCNIAKKISILAHKLFELIQVNKNSDESVRDFSDYTVSVKLTVIPSGVTLQRKVG